MKIQEIIEKHPLEIKAISDKLPLIGAACILGILIVLLIIIYEIY